MRSPTVGLIWEIWQRNRQAAWAVVGVTILARIIDVVDDGQVRSGGGDPGPLMELMAMIAFLLLFGIFNYTEPNGEKGVSRFPHRLFTLPVSTARLVAVPVLVGIAAVELLYLSWFGRLPGGAPAHPGYVALLLAAFMVFYQATLWSLAHRGALRLVVIGFAGVGLFWIGFLPSWPSSQPSIWRSEALLGGIVAALALAAFLLAWADVARLRSGGRRAASRLPPLVAAVADALPRRRDAFGSPSAAQVWFEWRSSGTPLPALVGVLLLLVFVPVSWLLRNDAGGSLRLLMAVLAMPVVLAVPVGMAFSKPTFWSEDLALPSFIAVRPLSADELVAIKIQVAARAVAVSWLLVLAFLAVWLPLWANLDSVSRLGIQLWAFHHHSEVAAYAIAALIVIAGVFLSWRFLIAGLWAGLSGNRRLFVGSVFVVVIAVIGALAFDADRLPAWMLGDPDRMSGLGWAVALAVIVKYWLAAGSWRNIAPRFVRHYLLAWLVGTACLIALGTMLWRIMRMYLAVDSYRLQGLLLLLALLPIPLWRLGLAPSLLHRNRHRR